MKVSASSSDPPTRPPMVSDMALRLSPEKRAARVRQGVRRRAAVGGRRKLRSQQWRQKERCHVFFHNLRVHSIPVAQGFFDFKPVRSRRQIFFINKERKSLKAKKVGQKKNNHLASLSATRRQLTMWAARHRGRYRFQRITALTGGTL